MSGGVSAECDASRHASCPGYFRMTHACLCPCHRKTDRREKR